MKLLELTSSRMLRRQRTANGNRAGMPSDDGDNVGCLGCSGCWGHHGDRGIIGAGGFAEFVGKENRATNGHLRNYFSAATSIKHGNNGNMMRCIQVFHVNGMIL